MNQSRQSNAPTVPSAGGALIASAAAAYTTAIPTVPIASTVAAAALPSISSLLDWLISLRITHEDAREYTVSLTDLGFDDLQSLQEVSGAYHYLENTKDIRFSPSDMDLEYVLLVPATMLRLTAIDMVDRAHVGVLGIVRVLFWSCFVRLVTLGSRTLRPLSVF